MQWKFSNVLLCEGIFLKKLYYAASALISSYFQVLQEWNDSALVPCDHCAR